MKLRDSFDGSSRFEGDRVLRWRSIPAGAKIVSARATVTPIDAKLGGPFAEPLSFNAALDNFGATRTPGTAGAGATLTTWVEVDFRARRTLAQVVGNFTNSSLQVDVGGGTYVEINQAGAFRTPSDTSTTATFPISGNTVSLPGLTVAKLKITNTGVSAVAPVLTSVVVSSVPTNVSLRVGELARFWTHLGEMTESETSPDFAAVLQAALVNAKIENGFYDLPLIIHSDTIARLQVDLEIEFLAQQDPLPNGLQEVVLPFDLSTLPQSTAATLNVAVPPNTRVVPERTTARVRGAFAESRIAYGPTGNVKPVAAVEVSPNSAQAQIIALDQPNDKDIPATAIDLLIESKTPSSRLRLDVRGDLDGKPGDTSLLAKPVELSVDQQAGKGARWTSVALSAEFVFSKSQATTAQTKPQRYWLVLQSLEGTVAWSVDQTLALNIQTTRDGGLSWRNAVAMAGTLRDQKVPGGGPFSAFFRLRIQPKTFKVPIDLQVGRDESEVRISLDRFEALGRVDFAFGTELAQGINASLDKAPPVTGPDTEHLHNGGLEHWLRVGNDIRTQTEFNFGAPIHAVAFSPDGTLAYVLDQISFKTGLILVVDVACNREIEEKKISLAITDPTTFVVTPDGRRAYVIGGGQLGTRLQVVDLTTSQKLGGLFDPVLGRNGSSSVLALSPDGARLYLATVNQITSPETLIRVVDTAILEQQVTSGAPPPAPLPVKQTIPRVPGQTNATPIALAVSPGGEFLYVLLGGSPNSIVKILDTTTFELLPRDLSAGPGVVANALALTLDGKVAVVINGDDDTASVIDTANGSSRPIRVGPSPIDVAVSPDGRLAYALNKGAPPSISSIDLSRQAADKNFPAVDITLAPARVPVALAVAPTGDQIYVAANTSNSAISSVFPIQFGVQLPSEWHLTSGAVTPVCLGAPFHLVGVLGHDSMSTGFSQVTPVAASSAYEFSFWGIAREPATNESPGLAEVLWLGSDCGPLGTVQVPIKAMEIQADGNAMTAFIAALSSQPAPLELHRVRLTSPAGADQAEVRFTVPGAGTAAIDLVSLITTSEATENADFKVRLNGQLAGWTVFPGVAPGFTVLDSADGIQLRNAGAATAELVQIAPARSGEPFTLEFQGKAVASSPSPNNPGVELRWLKADGSPAGSPTTIEILPTGPGSSVAAGTAPADATQVEIHLSVPPRSALKAKSVSLRFAATTIVPVTFIAQAPGELTVSDVQVAFNQIDPVPRPIPERGLCIPTPPGCQPGETDEDCCFCHQCESEQTMVEPQLVMTAANRPAVMSRCANCGNELLRVGGPGVSDTQPLPPMLSGGATPMVIRSAPMTTTRESLETAAPRLNNIHGIGEARAKQLSDIGIDSVEKLAAATPAQVSAIKFITPSMAEAIIAEAKSLIQS